MSGNTIGEELRTKGPLGGSPYRNGVVHAQHVDGVRVQVRFPDRDNVVSHWLPIVVGWSQDNKAFHLPDVGEQVVCLMDAFDEDGCVLGAVYSTVDGPPVGMTADKHHVRYKDGTSVEYDRAQHVLTITVAAGGHVNLSADHVNVVSDDVKIGNGAELPIMLNTIIAKFNTHVHSGVEPGGSSTAVPTTLFVEGDDDTTHVVAK